MDVSYLQVRSAVQVVGKQLQLLDHIPTSDEFKHICEEAFPSNFRM